MSFGLFAAFVLANLYCVVYENAGLIDSGVSSPSTLTLAFSLEGNFRCFDSSSSP